MARAALIWDEDCGFCARTVRLVPRLRLDADVVAWQQADLPALGLGEEACRRAVQWVGTDSASVEGGRAVAAALSASPTRWRVLGWAASLPGVRAVVDAAYRVVAANRHRLPGSTPACDVTAS
jgi:predicted DCC family thiol-disulfide oxidoreductase YuxK